MMRWLLRLLPWGLSFLVMPAHADLVILQYHHIATDTPASTSTAPALFKEQLNLIAELKIPVVPLEEATRKALKGEDDGKPYVAITFDDAFESIYTTALPLLKQQGYPFTVFVNTDAVDHHHRHYMTWTQLQTLAATPGVTIGGHTSDHAHLVPRPGESAAHWKKRVAQSMDSGMSRLREKLGSKTTLFAYPYGEYDKALEAMVKQRGWLAYGQQSGPVGPDSDPQALPRFPAANSYGQIGPLHNKLLSRAFPIEASLLPNPVIQSNPPSLQLHLPDHWKADRLHCYGSQRGALPMTLNQSTKMVEITPSKAFTGRRFRYNCTYPAGDNRFFWLSQPWINPEEKED